MNVTDIRNIRYRQIRPEDWHRLQRFHHRLSDTTVELRFHGAKRELSTPLAHRFTDIDGKHDVAILATTGTRGRIVGVARYYSLTPDCAEVAFVLEDGYQHHGIGSRLMKRLRAIAMANGIKRFVAEVIPGNTAMFRLMAEAGHTRSQFSQGVCEVVAELERP